MPTIIQRGHPGSRVDHRVYTQAEADASTDPLVRAYVPWHETMAAGQWGLSDDGYVLELLRIKTYPKGRPPKSRLRSFSVGRVWQSIYRRVDGSVGLSQSLYNVGEWLEAGVGFSETTPSRWDEQEARKTRAINAARYAVRIWISKGGKLTWKDWDEIGLVYRPKDEKPGATATVFFKTPAGVALFNEQLAVALGMAEITQDDVNELLLQGFRATLEKGNSRDALAFIDRLQDVANRQPHGRTEPPIGTSRQLAERAESQQVPDDPFQGFGLDGVEDAEFEEIPDDPDDE